MRPEVAVVLLALSACQSVPPASTDGPAVLNEPPTLQFTAGRPSTSETADAASARLDGRTLTIQGVASAPDPCQRVSGSVGADGDSITLTVTVQSLRQPCMAVIAGYPFEGTLSGLEAGSRTVRVVFTYPGTGWETKTVLDTRVDIQ